MMAQIVEARAGMTRPGPQSDLPEQVNEHCDHGGVAEGCPIEGNEHGGL